MDDSDWTNRIRYHVFDTTSSIPDPTLSYLEQRGKIFQSVRDDMASTNYSPYVQAYLFDGYWEDIGTVEAFYNANLQCNETEPKFSFYSKAGGCKSNRCKRSTTIPQPLHNRFTTIPATIPATIPETVI